MADSTIFSNWTSDMPQHLKDYDALTQDIRSTLEGLSKVEKGERFAQFVQNLVPQSDLNWQFDTPALNPKRSNDEGVDLTAAGKDKQSTLYIQSRLWIDRAETIDSILTKFKDYLAQRGVGPDGTASMFDLFEEHPVHFLVATLSRLEGIRKQYERHEYGNKAFYRDLMDKKRLHFIDGAEILKILRSTYRRVSDSPDRLVLNLETPVISKDNVYIGIISSKELKRLYDQFNESLFFENLRDFQGLTPQKGRKSPNMEIVTTVTTYPDKMLERNNGIVIKAEVVEPDNKGNRLVLTRGSIVNGCQTTTCLVRYPNDISSVLVKVVQTSDPWDITESANLQNQVSDIDLTISRTMRSQLANRAGAQLNYRLDIAKDSAFHLLATVNRREVVFDEVRLLYIGLMSRTPNTIFTGNYTDFRQDVAIEFYNEDRYGTQIYEALFALQQASSEALKKAKATFKHKSDAVAVGRLVGHNATYRCFIAILALCATLDIDVSNRYSEKLAEFDRMKDFFEKTINVLRGDQKQFQKYYRHSCKEWMDQVMPSNRTEDEIREYIATDTKRLSFSGLLRTIHREVANYEQMLRDDMEG